MKIAFAYAGQGSQRTGMGKDLYENYESFKKVFDEDYIPETIKELCFFGPDEELNKTSNTQPAMAAFAIGVTKVLKENNIVPDYAFGLSLGEYSALYCSGVFSEKDLMDVLSFRGARMQEEAEKSNTTMAAVLGLSSDKVLEACDEAKKAGKVFVANYNCPGQIVIGGEEEAVSFACDKAKELGAKRGIKLSVSGAFHTEFMYPVAEKLGEKFQDIHFGEMNIPVVFNAVARTKNDDENIKDLLKKQVYSSVYLEQSINFLIENGVDTIIEIGPGKALSGFVKKVNKEVKTFKIDKAEDLEEVINYFKEME